MTQQDRNQRHILEQQESGPSAASTDRLTALRAAGARKAAREAFWSDALDVDTWALDPTAAQREADYLVYLGGGMDPRD